jgi:hypothetical protein
MGRAAVWKTTIHVQGVEVDDGLRAHIEERMRDALAGMESRVQLVHVRLYGGVPGTDLHTCYIRVESLPSSSIALGDTAASVGGAVTRAAARIRAAVGTGVEKAPSAGSRALKTPGYPLST